MNNKIIKVFNYLSHTGEYIGSSDYMLKAAGVLDGFCTDIAPLDKKDGFAVVFDINKNSWSHVRDYRGTAVYDTDTAQKHEVYELGELPENVTTHAPDIDNPVWDGEKWVENKEIPIEEPNQSPTA